LVRGRARINAPRGCPQTLQEAKPMAGSRPAAMTTAGAPADGSEAQKSNATNSGFTSSESIRQRIERANVNHPDENQSGRDGGANGRWARNGRNVVPPDGGQNCEGQEPHERRRASRGKTNRLARLREPEPRVAEHRAEGTRRCMTRVGRRIQAEPLECGRIARERESGSPGTTCTRRSKTTGMGCSQTFNRRIRAARRRMST